jgi:hypothetical protein
VNDAEKQILTNQIAIMTGVAGLIVSQASAAGKSLFLVNSAVEALGDACDSTEKLLHSDEKEERRKK